MCIVVSSPLPDCSVICFAVACSCEPIAYPFLPLARRFSKNLFGHDQGGKTIRERVDTRARLSMCAAVRPYDVEARVYVRDRELVKSAVAERQRGQVVCMCDLAHNLLKDVQGQIQKALGFLGLPLDCQGLLPFALPDAARSQSRAGYVGLMAVLVESCTDVLHVLGWFGGRVRVCHRRHARCSRLRDLRGRNGVVPRIVVEGRRRGRFA